ncbi:MAG: ABC transporter ATP-binding protein [Proteobacteria bacterium]|nr:ABC transporter ATP-binding protein [Pseudomonadota bacterium]
MIRARGVSVSIPGGRSILEPLDFELGESGGQSAGKGSVLGVFGPNGSGKSTLLRAISGHPGGGVVSGEVRIHGEPVGRRTPARERARRVIYLGSDFRAPFGLKVLDLFEIGVRADSTGWNPEVKPAELERIWNVVETLGIADFLPRIFQTLSDGERQLMMFARGLIQAPRALVLDETFSKLDLDRLIAVSGIIRGWVGCGMDFVIASHDLNFLSEVSDRLLLLKKGRKIAEGPVGEVISEENLAELFQRARPRIVTESGRKKIVY